MAKMNKEQREIVHTMLHEAAAKKLTKQFSTLLKKFKCEVKTNRSYRKGNYILHVYLSTTNSTKAPIIKAVYNDALKAKSFTVTLNKDNRLETKFHKSVDKRYETVTKPIKVIEAEIEKFNCKMDKEFLLTTAFNDIADVHEFVKNFIK